MLMVKYSVCLLPITNFRVIKIICMGFYFNFRGAAATVIDECAGILSFIINDYKPTATAYLNITYKKPFKIGTEHYFKAWVKK